MKSLLAGALLLLPLLAAGESPVSPNIVKEGKGEHRYYDCTDFYITRYGAGIDYVNDDVKAMEICFDGNTVYMKEPFCGLTTRSYIVGELEGNRITFEFPQMVKTETVSGMTRDYYASVLKASYTTGSDGRQKLTYVATEGANEMIFLLDGEGNLESPYAGDTSQTFPDFILGLVDSNGDWAGYGDANYRITYRADLKVNTPPATAVWEKWNYEFDDDGSLTDVVFDGDDVYFGSLGAQCRNFVKGRIEGDKIVVEGPQFMGTSGGMWTYLTALPVEKVTEGDNWFYDFPTTWELEDDDPLPWLERVELAYDREKKTIANTTDAWFYNLASLDVFYPAVTMAYPQFRKPAENPVYAAPRTPHISWYGFSDSMGAFFVDLPKYDVNNNLLDLDNTYYEVWFDGKQKTFGQPEYMYVYEDMDEIPYLFNDGFDIQQGGNIEHLIYYFEEANKIEVYLCHLAPDGKVYRSAPGVWSASGIGSAPAEDDAEAAETEYYDLQGLRVGNPAKGLYLKRTTLRDGSVRISKTLRAD